MRTIPVDRNIKSKNASWNFGNKVANKFQGHVENSVPFYSEGHEIILKLSDFFISKDSIIYDLGCSTGLLAKKIVLQHSEKKFKIYALDSEKEMIKFAKKNNKNNKINYLNKDIINYKFIKTDLFISYYTIQFIKPKYRQKLFNKIFKSLNWGGALIIFEKALLEFAHL